VTVKILKFIAVVVVVVAMGLAVGWFGSRGPSGGLPPAPASGPVARPTAEPSPAPAKTPVAVQPQPAADAMAGAAAPAADTLVVLTNWEEKVDQILGGDAKEDEKAKQMLDLFPRLPEEGQVEVAQHLSNLLPDQDFASLTKYITNSSTPGPVLDVLMSGLLNRPNSIKLPTLLEVARTEQNPKANDARELLQLFLEENYGNDWAKWQDKLTQWLKDNPD